MIFKAGVNKLTEAKKVVQALKSEAAVQEQKLAEKQQKANLSLQMITETMKNANTQKSEMETLKEQTELESEKHIFRQENLTLFVPLQCMLNMIKINKLSIYF